MKKDYIFDILKNPKRIIKDDDGSAFVTISDVSEIVGTHIKKKKE